MNEPSSWHAKLRQLPAFAIIEHVYTPAAMPNHEPARSAYVDFEFAPHFSLPAVSELTQDIVDTIRADIDNYAAELKKVVGDIQRVAASLGELPISVESGNNVLRIHFPNSEPSKVETLLHDADISRGIVSERYIPSYASSSSSASSGFSAGAEMWGNSSSSGYCMTFSDDMLTPGLTTGTRSETTTETNSF
jgi:hypothetical protein